MTETDETPTDWRDETCQTCTYRVREDCRRYPPTPIVIDDVVRHWYPVACFDALDPLSDTGRSLAYTVACAEYAACEGAQAQP